VQVDPIKPTLKAHRTMRLKPIYVKLLSSFAFKSNWRRYIQEMQGGARATRYPVSIWEMTLSTLSSPISLALIPYRSPG
jgi:hypothetical protein